MERNDIRWEQRFTNYKKALAKLSDAVTSAKEENLSELEKEGLVQRFEYTYELAWKTLQDLLRYKGYTDIAGPNIVLTQAFSDGYIDDDTGWRGLKKSRELASHTYNQETADEIVESITQTYWSLLKKLEARLEQERYGRQTTLFNE
ncbi:nucleotidyltransferase substrate binding protein [Spirosoma sp.]|uniref:nucleotidyltransferase substrate binding protein n=1 Tax=Spirosoma sp. TaxID=1899569 RepID=UPI003B3B2247